MTIHLMIQLRGVDNPPVWRRIIIPGDFTFDELHKAIQADFGWCNEHLYQFQKEPYSRGWTITDMKRNGDGFRQKPIDAAKTEVGRFLKEKKLKELYQDAIDAILENPFIAEEKTGDLKGIRSYDIYYAKINYELAYTIEFVQIEGQDEPDMIVVIMAGARENFYDELKRYMK